MPITNLCILDFSFAILSQNICPSTIPLIQSPGHDFIIVEFYSLKGSHPFNPDMFTDMFMNVSQEWSDTLKCLKAKLSDKISQVNASLRPEWHPHQVSLLLWTSICDKMQMHIHSFNLLGYCLRTSTVKMFVLPEMFQLPCTKPKKMTMLYTRTDTKASNEWNIYISLLKNSLRADQSQWGQSR